MMSGRGQLLQGPDARRAIASPAVKAFPSIPREKFVHDFVAAWSKVMNLDRYEVAKSG